MLAAMLKSLRRGDVLEELGKLHLVLKEPDEHGCALLLSEERDCAGLVPLAELDARTRLVGRAALDAALRGDGQASKDPTP